MHFRTVMFPLVFRTLFRPAICATDNLYHSDIGSKIQDTNKSFLLIELIYLPSSANSLIEIHRVYFDLHALSVNPNCRNRYIHSSGKGIQNSFFAHANGRTILLIKQMLFAHFAVQKCSKGIHFMSNMVHLFNSKKERILDSHAETVPVVKFTCGNTE